MIENQTKENFTPLLVCVKMNNLEACQYLISLDVNLYASCIKMQNALHYAVLNKNKEMISFLCDLDSD